MKLVCYIRGGLGDIWPAVSAIKNIQEVNKISKFNTLVITDSVYYFRDYPPTLEKFSLDMIHKVTPNIIEVPPWINNNFNLSINDVTDELSQENADKMKKEFMFWRPQSLKDFVNDFFDDKTIFIDALFTECIMEWDFDKKEYKRIKNIRNSFQFNPPLFIKNIINGMFNTYKKHILIHVRKKKEGDSYTESDRFYNEIIEYCNLKGIMPILIGIDVGNIKGIYVNLTGNNALGFETMGYVIDECKIMLGNDSGFSAIKLYQQQKDKLLIMNYPRWSRSPWYFRAIKDKSNCLLLNAQENNIEKIKQSIGEYYEKRK